MMYIRLSRAITISKGESIMMAATGPVTISLASDGWHVVDAFGRGGKRRRREPLEIASPQPIGLNKRLYGGRIRLAPRSDA